MTDLPRKVKVGAWVGGFLFWTVLLLLQSDGGLPLADAILVAVLLVAVPAFALAQLPLVADVPVARLPAYWGSIAALWMIGSSSWLVGSRSGGAASVGLVGLSPVGLLGWAAALTIACLLVVLVFRQLAIWAGAVESPLLRDLLPRTAKERRVFALLSLAAGVGEELAYRGYAILVLAPLVGTWGAVVLTSVVFGVLHAYQGLLGMVRTALMGGVLAWGFLASGSLWPAIIAHVALDLLAGLAFGERLLPPARPASVVGAAPRSPVTER
ncbi:MAG: type II CAAX endopeptidase family protein [Longimicrobiales bacterium]